MKNNVLIAILAILFFSCSSEATFENPSPTRNFEPEVIYQDNNFKTFIEIITEISKYKVNSKKLEKSLAIQDHEAIAISSGFRSLNEALEVNGKIIKIFEELDNNFQLSKLSKDERDKFFKNGFDYYSTEFLPLKSCETDRQLCFNNAIKDFAVAAGGCGVATAGAAIAGPIAAGLTALVCLGTATYVLDIDRGNCNIKYNCSQQ